MKEAGHSRSPPFYRKEATVQMGKGPSWGYMLIDGRTGELGQAASLCLGALPLPMTCRETFSLPGFMRQELGSP